MSYEVVTLNLPVLEHDYQKYADLYAAFFTGDDERIDRHIGEVLFQDLALELGEDYSLPRPDNATEEIAILNTTVIKHGRMGWKDFELNRWSRKRPRSLDDMFIKHFEMRDDLKTKKIKFPITPYGRKIYYETRRESIKKRSHIRYFNSIVIARGSDTVKFRHSLQKA